MQISFVSNGPEDTYGFGAQLGPLLRPGDVVCLEGELGTGKTVLAKGIAEGLGINDDITSPTYTLINEYYGDIALYHFDLYRLEDGEELFYIGGEALLYGQGVSVIEWASRARELLPRDCIWIYLSMLEHNESSRCIRIVATEKHYGVLEHFNARTKQPSDCAKGSVNILRSHRKDGER